MNPRRKADGIAMPPSFTRGILTITLARMGGQYPWHEARGMHATPLRGRRAARIVHVTNDSKYDNNSAHNNSAQKKRVL